MTSPMCFYNGVYWPVFQWLISSSISCSTTRNIFEHCNVLPGILMFVYTQLIRIVLMQTEGVPVFSYLADCNIIHREVAGVLSLRGWISSHPIIGSCK